MNLDIFEMVDSFCDDMLHHKQNRIEDCHALIQKFGEHYRLLPSVPINVTRHALEGIRSLADRLGISIGPLPD